MHAADHRRPSPVIFDASTLVRLDRGKHDALACDSTVGFTFCAFLSRASASELNRNAIHQVGA